MTPHPQRCETCQHAPVKRINKKYDNFETYRYFCKKYDMWIFGTAYNTIEITGCASHSSAPTEREPQCLCETCCMTVEQCRGQQLRQASPAPTEQDERDKVLDKICKICPLLDERPEICEECVVYSVRTPTPEAQR